MSDTGTGNTRESMFLYQPLPGYWYANALGQLQQVRLVLHEGGSARRLVLENISGQRQTVDIGDWSHLGLTLHSPGVECRHRRRREDAADNSESF